MGAWPREVAAGERDAPPYHIADLVRTSFAVEALIKAGRGVDQEPVKNAVNWLLHCRRLDNGWSGHKESASTFMPTCFVLLALIEACRAGMTRCKRKIEEGVRFLVDHYQKPEGCFDDPGPLRAVHTIYGTLTLQAVRRANLGRYAQEEKQAIEWLLRHPDEARKQVEEQLEIDPRGRGNYGFLFMTESLLIRSLMSSEDKKYRERAGPWCNVQP